MLGRKLGRVDIRDLREAITRKTQPHDGDVDAFLASVSDGKRREDAVDRGVLKELVERAWETTRR